jgi:hypothetical protein
MASKLFQQVTLRFKTVYTYLSQLLLLVDRKVQVFLENPLDNNFKASFVIRQMQVRWQHQSVVVHVSSDQSLTSEFLCPSMGVDGNKL